MSQVNFVNTFALQEKIKKAAIDGLKTVAEEVLTEAKDLAPIDKGILRMSGQVSDNNKVKFFTNDGNETQEKLTESDRDEAIFISFNTPYAWKQHENVDLNHPNGGEDHYLEKAFDRVATQERINKRVSESIGKVLR